MSFVGQTSNPIKFEIVDEPEIKTVFVIGCIGDGKSTLLNKLQLIINKDQPKLEKYFISTNSTETVTKEIKSLDLQG